MATATDTDPTIGTDTARDLQRTLVLLKPSVIRRGIEHLLFARYKQEGLDIVMIRVLNRTPSWWGTFYQKHHDRPLLLRGLINFMTSGISIALLIEGANAVETVRTLNGATNPAEAEPGSIRHDYSRGSQLPDNLVYGSESPSDAEREIAFVFGENAVC